jgi:glycerophosphoryl diester phosphodiesterase
MRVTGRASLYVQGTVDPVEALTPMRYGGTPGILAIAHRGGAGLAAENTMAAFERSYALGLRYLETDVRLSADGVLVVFHDANLDRVTDGQGPVSAATYAQLRRLRVNGLHRIPTLTEVLQRFPDACFTIDLKDERATEQLARVLIQTGSAHRVCVAGAWDGWLHNLREQVGPELATALGWRDLVALVASTHARVGLPGVRFRGTFAHVPLRFGRLPVFGERLITRARRIGISIIVWTVDEPDQMHRLVDAGVAGIITDRPDRLREVLIARGQWIAPTTLRLIGHREQDTA